MAKSQEVFTLITAVFNAFPQSGKLKSLRSDKFLAGPWTEGKHYDKGSKRGVNNLTSDNAC